MDKNWSQSSHFFKIFWGIPLERHALHVISLVEHLSMYLSPLAHSIIGAVSWPWPDYPGEDGKLIAGIASLQTSCGWLEYTYIFILLYVHAYINVTMDKQHLVNMRHIQLRTLCIRDYVPWYRSNAAMHSHDTFSILVVCLSDHCLQS